MPFRELINPPDEDRYEAVSRLPAHACTVSISGTQVRKELLQQVHLFPEWFTRPEVARS